MCLRCILLPFSFQFFKLSEAMTSLKGSMNSEGKGDDGGPAGTAELEEEWWVASGVGILKLSVLLYSNTAIFHVQVEVHVEISF